MSWSQGRNSKEVEPRSKRLEKLSIVNGVLKKLSLDEDLHDDLKLKNVQVAVNHWIGTNRLNTQEVSKLFENRRVVYVYQRIQMIQHACLTAGIPVPFDHFVKGLDHLDFKIAIKCFGFDIIDDPAFPSELYKNEIVEYLKQVKNPSEKEGKVNNETVKEEPSNVKESKSAVESEHKTLDYSKVFFETIRQILLVLLISFIVFYFNIPGHFNDYFSKTL